jgi:hypothetical protein
MTYKPRFEEICCNIVNERKAAAKRAPFRPKRPSKLEIDELVVLLVPEFQQQNDKAERKR